jgi:uncharacterized cupin superfamily protein
MTPTVSAEDSAAPYARMAAEVPARAVPSRYPAPFRDRMAGRTKRALGDAFGLRNFGVNLTTLAPGAMTALFHRHTVQDEFVYVLEGCPTLVTDRGEELLRPGACAGFSAGGTAHHLVNRSDAEVVLLEVGDRSPGDAGTYPGDDLVAVLQADGRWGFTHRDGTPYPP